MEIKHEGGRYVLYISGKFAGSYDTFTEAVRAYEQYEEGIA